MGFWVFEWTSHDVNRAVHTHKDGFHVLAMAGLLHHQEWCKSRDERMGVSDAWRAIHYMFIMICIDMTCMCSCMCISACIFIGMCMRLYICRWCVCMQVTLCVYEKCKVILSIFSMIDHHVFKHWHGLWIFINKWKEPGCFPSLKATGHRDIEQVVV